MQGWEPTVLANFEYMKPRTSKYHNWQEGDCGKPIKVGYYYKKGFWKRYDRKRYYRNLFKKEFANLFFTNDTNGKESKKT